MRRADRRPGFDLTFSAPKGVSLLWAFGSPEVRDAVSSAHDRAIAGVIDHLSAEAAYVRRGKDGKEIREGQGVPGRRLPAPHQPVRRPAAAHPRPRSRTSSAALDGRWSAPDMRQLYLWQKAATAMYHSALRAELAPSRLSLERRAQQPGGALRHSERYLAGVLQAPGRHRGGRSRTRASVPSVPPRWPPSPPDRPSPVVSRTTMPCARAGSGASVL